MNKIDLFKTELSYIKNLKYRESAKKMIELLPDYFFEIPASSTGKHHPKFAQNEGGLVRHTKVAVRMCYELSKNNTIGYSFTDDEKDLMLIALIMHDGVKSGLIKEKYTRVDHPLLCLPFLFLCFEVDQSLKCRNSQIIAFQITLLVGLLKYLSFLNLAFHL